jgi:hypothetical protein
VTCSSSSERGLLLKRGPLDEVERDIAVGQRHGCSSSHAASGRRGTDGRANSKHIKLSVCCARQVKFIHKNTSSLLMHLIDIIRIAAPLARERGGDTCHIPTYFVAGQLSYLLGSETIIAHNNALLSITIICPKSSLILNKNQVEAS